GDRPSRSPKAPESFPIPPSLAATVDSSRLGRRIGGASRWPALRCEHDRESWMVPPMGRLEPKSDLPPVFVAVPKAATNICRKVHKTLPLIHSPMKGSMVAWQRRMNEASGASAFKVEERLVVRS